MEFREEGRGGTGDLVGIGSRGGVQGRRTGRFECDGGRGGVQGGGTGYLRIVGG